ncbi:MAG: ISNCY family transposase, partial [Spirochaetaceae bacterium]|nr:ISNCY family transposase [Spirochaetaceae bacterium]
VGHLASCGRTRWKIENEHNNVLKNRGYNLQHNFGHGKKHASEVFFILNLTGFQLHTILELGDKDFREARKHAGRCDMFFYEMHAALRYVLHETWRDFLVFITADEDME